MNPQNSPLNSHSRRDFIKTSAAISGVLAANIAIPSGRAQTSETIKVGLVGCGGRGSGAASQALSSDKNVVLHSIGDAFEDRLQQGLGSLKNSHKEKVKVDPDHAFVGLDAYQKVIDSGVDVVILATPPGFRPQHLAAAIAAGKHVFCEKPMAVDGPGVRTVLAAAEQARQKNLCLASGFCWRSHYPKRETFARVLGGDLGQISSIYTTYNTGPVKDVTIRKEGWTPMELQVRNWYQFSWLSGDHIVEQAVHSLDMMAWAMGDVVPVRATANGGRQARTSLGNIYDHFAVVYEYANGTRGFHHCRQIAGCSNDYAVHMAGTKGNCTVDCTRNKHVITGEKPWQFTTDKEITDMYQVEHNELFAAIRAGKTINHGTWMAHSTMLAILGRMAAYTGQTITWEQAINSQEVLAPAVLGWDAPVEVPPIPMPGKTKLV
jgi:myo-inositol 2-dehydrogenase/D-chiro-inositol 1-dehydrogenase